MNIRINNLLLLLLLNIPSLKSDLDSLNLIQSFIYIFEQVAIVVKIIVIRVKYNPIPFLFIM